MYLEYICVVLIGDFVEEKGIFGKLHKACRILGENVDNAKNGVKVIHIHKRLKKRYI